MEHPSFRDVRELAHQLWQDMGSPPADQVPPEHFWYEAERNLTPAVILAIAQELRAFDIHRRPGDGFHADYYFYNNQESPYAFGSVDDNGIYVLCIRDYVRVRFDLNREDSLNDLIEFLKANTTTIQAEVNLQPTWKLVTSLDVAMVDAYVSSTKIWGT